MTTVHFFLLAGLVVVSPHIREQHAVILGVVALIAALIAWWLE